MALRESALPCSMSCLIQTETLPTREEIAWQIMEIAAAWGRPMPREKAEKMAYAATASPWPWLPVLVSTAIWAAILLAVFAAK
jgi:hypothetical protein